MAQSRDQLLIWLNNLLQLNVTKVDDCGTGAALCQIYDSIYKDFPLSRVKFDANTEYAYLQNFKHLQAWFTKHGIERSIPVQSLIKCKPQDNLEFLQWTKVFWDEKYRGGEYDAVARRKGAGAPAAAPAPTSSARTSGAGAARRGTTRTTAAPRRTAVAGGGGAVSAAATQEINSLKETVTGLERERDFYFSKLRDIELLLQQACEADPGLEKDEDSLIKQIQAILYSTEEGFEIPADDGVVDDQETF
ncbi:MAG: hypothetical protein LQ338_003981 [Usnochroma carphineum]|nr:MAG: hypothetical protein LQ338_003981 [Usnochroma carphineum]